MSTMITFAANNEFFRKRKRVHKACDSCKKRRVRPPLPLSLLVPFTYAHPEALRSHLRRRGRRTSPYFSFGNRLALVPSILLVRSISSKRNSDFSGHFL